MHRTLSEAATSGAYEPFAGPITLDTLDDLFAHQRARFAGVTMKDDGDDEEEFDTGDDDEKDGGDDDDDGEKDDDADDDDDDEGGKDAPAKAALKREREKVKALRRELAEARKAGAKKDDDGDGDGDAEKKAEAKWKPRLINSAAKTALLAAGADKPERLLRLLDSDSLDVDDDGEVEGLDDEVDRLKEEYPELFSTKRSKRRVETGDRSGGGPKKTLSATERQAQLLTGKK